MDEHLKDLFNEACGRCSGKRPTWTEEGLVCPTGFRKCEVRKISQRVMQQGEGAALDHLLSLIRPQTYHTTSPEKDLTAEFHASYQRTKELWIVYSGASYRAGGGGQRPSQMALALAAQSTVLFLARNETLDQQGNLFRAAPELLGKFKIEALPHVTSLLAFPDSTGLALMKTLKDYGPVIYDCIDFWPGFAEKIPVSRDDEAALVKVADLVTVSAPRLQKWIQWLDEKAKVVLLPNATSPHAWRNFSSRPPADLVRGKKTIFYCGHLTGSWLDWPLIEGVINNSPRDWEFNFLGALPEHPFEHPRLHYLGLKPHSEIGNYLRWGEAGLIPFVQSRLTECVSALKTFDYLANGCSVIATPMADVGNLPGCTVASTAEEFLAYLIVAERLPESFIEEVRREHTFLRRAEVLRREVAALRPAPPSTLPTLTLPESVQERLRAGLYRPEIATRRAAWLVGTSCNFTCPYCNALAQACQKPYTVTEARVAWQQWTQRYGPCQITCTGLETMHDDEFRPLLGELSKDHILDINTNLSFPLEKLEEFIVPDHVYFTASYHPYAGVPLETFLEKIKTIQEGGFHVTGASLVLYPPLLKRAAAIKQQIEAAGLFFLAHPFRGEFKGKDYPESYTLEEKALLRPLVEELSWEHNVEDKETLGKLCLAGVNYFSLDFKGNYRRCPAAPYEGLFFKEKVSLSTWPQPCPVMVGCHCNDLWRYILSEEESREVMAHVLPT